MNSNRKKIQPFQSQRRHLNANRVYTRIPRGQDRTPCKFEPHEHNSEPWLLQCTGDSRSVHQMQLTHPLQETHFLSPTRQESTWRKSFVEYSKPRANLRGARPQVARLPETSAGMTQCTCFLASSPGAARIGYRLDVIACFHELRQRQENDRHVGRGQSTLEYDNTEAAHAASMSE